MSKNIIREMTDLINQMIANRNFQGAVDSLSIYKDSFGIDEIYQHFNERLLKWENSPKIAVICLECSEEEIQEEIINQSFLNIELVLWSKEDGNLIDNLVEYLTMTTAEYICFLESKHKIHPSKIESMFKYIKHTQDVDAVICKRFFINAQQIIIKHQNFECDKILDHKPIPGDILLESCFKDGINIYNNLTCLLIKTEKLKKIKFKKFDTSFVELEKTYVLYQILISSYVQLMDNTLVTRFSIKEDKNKYQLLKRDFCKLVETMGMELPIKIEKDYSGIEKKITCFYTDKGEYYNLKPIGDEAKKRGYEVKYTENINEKAEIGIYCQHQCFPKNSKFSMVLLHDMAQAHNRWPNIWQAENWHEFDIGILPGKMWADYWEESGGDLFANPILGCYLLGYPKSDVVFDEKLINRANEMKKKLNLKYDYTVLYAPSWENDEKEDDFVRALASLNVNLLIKQASWNEAYQHVIDDIKKMRSMHEGKYDNVFYLEPEENILTALSICDLVVSDESSVMLEAYMFNKPSIAVIDWLIPDIEPKRFAYVPFDFVEKCKRVELRERVENHSKGKQLNSNFSEIKEKIYFNQGNCCNDILDAIEYYTANGENKNFKKWKLESKYMKYDMWD